MKNSNKFLVLLSLFSLLSACNKNTSSSSDSSDIVEESSSSEESSISHDELVFNINLKDTTYEFHSEKQLAYLNDDYENVRNYADGLYEYSRPVAFELSWETSGNPLGVFKNYRFNLYENEINDTNLIVYDRVAPHISLINLKMDTTYYFSIDAIYSLQNYSSDINQFVTTSLGPRNLYIEGVKNARDIGGYVLEDESGFVNQGLIYRTARLNKSETTRVVQEITEYGIQTMREQLKIKSEIDLRHNWLSGGAYETGGLVDTSLLGDDINYYQCPLNYSSSDILSLNKEMFKTIFDLLMDKNNYPLFYHCDIGTDRTGLLTIYLLGMFGVSINDIYRDYLFSNFSNIGDDRSLLDIANNINFINSHDGDTFKDRVIATLLESGITLNQIETISNYMITKGGK